MKQPSPSLSFLGIGLLSPFAFGPVLVALPVLALTRQWPIAASTAAITGGVIIGVLQAAYRQAQKLH